MYSLTNGQLRRVYKTYSNDSSLRSKFRFGQYLHDTTMDRGYCWPRLYYASDGEAYTLAYKHINCEPTREVRKVL